MRLALKLTTAISFAVLIGLTVQAVMHHERMRDVLHREARDDLLVLARAMEDAVSGIWASSGEDAARRYVERSSIDRATTTVDLVAPSDAQSFASTVTLAPSGELVTKVPIVVDGRAVAALVFHRSLEAEHDFTRALISSQVMTTLGLVLVIGALALLLGHLFVARPTRHLIDQVQRIGKGNYEPAPEIAQRDEVGALARAINDAASRLRQAQSVAREQRRARAEALEQLRHADRLSSVGKLASGIAHELGTPLNVVSGRASMIASSDASDDVKRDARIIEERAEHMANIIRQLLGFARRGVHKQRTSVEELLARAVTLVEPLAETRDVRIHVDTLEHGHRANVDSGKVLQVLTNLMVNAVQAMPDGGTITLRASSEQVDSPPDEHAVPGRYVHLVVEDEGVGIPVEELEQIFHPFFTTKSDREGTGLGLSVCHGLVREHGGWIDVDSAPGRGSRFAVYLPEGEPE